MNWLRKCFARRPQNRLTPRPRIVPQLESLEARVVPSLTQVTATGGDPFNGVVSIVVTYNDIPNATFSGSGAFIDAAHVLTAAHVLWNPNSTDNGGFPDHL